MHGVTPIAIFYGHNILHELGQVFITQAQLSACSQISLGTLQGSPIPPIYYRNIIAIPNDFTFQVILPEAECLYTGRSLCTIIILIIVAAFYNYHSYSSKIHASLS